MLRERFTDVRYDRLDREGKTVLDIFRGPGVKLMVRCGDGEMTLLRDRNPEWLAQNVAEAVKHADCVGMPTPGFNDWREQIMDSLRTHYQVEGEQLLTVDPFLFDKTPELIGQLAQGKRVLWITCGADKIVRHMNDPAFRDYYGLNGIIDNDSIEVATPAGTNSGGPWPKSISLEQSYSDIKQHLTRARDFDLAFVGAGWVGKPVCHHIKKHLGRSAVDIGAMMGAMAGLRNRTIFRRRRHFLVWDPDGDFVPET